MKKATLAILAIVACASLSIAQLPDETSAKIPELDAFHKPIYEQLVRLVRPVVKELDAFHQVVYMLHHYYMPEYKAAEVKASADSLMLKMEALNGASLPKRPEAKNEQFTKARKNLDEAVKAFAEGVKSKKGKDELAKLENTLHARYQVVENVFE